VQHDGIYGDVMCMTAAGITLPLGIITIWRLRDAWMGSWRRKVGAEPSPVATNFGG